MRNMSKQCEIVRDILPLYVDGACSEASTEMIKEHLETCADCRAIYEQMCSHTNEDILQKEKDGVIARHEKTEKKKSRRRIVFVSVFVASVCLVLCIMLHYFPVYRLVQFGPSVFSDYYSYDQITKALYIGSAADRKEVQAVLRLADKAFHDTRHTRAENEEEYGLLSRYATPTDSYDNVAFVEYSLELLSAHLDDDEGWIWVYYSSEAFDHDGNSVCGSWRIPSLWKVEKNDTGEWVVVQIREHP